MHPHFPVTEVNSPQQHDQNYQQWPFQLWRKTKISPLRGNPKSLWLQPPCSSHLCRSFSSDGINWLKPHDRKNSFSLKHLTSSTPQKAELIWQEMKGTAESALEVASFPFPLHNLHAYFGCERCILWQLPSELLKNGADHKIFSLTPPTNPQQQKREGWWSYTVAQHAKGMAYILQSCLNTWKAIHTEVN